MSQLTKNAIIECTLELASEMPINKIKIRDITDRCKITRNTFYYHFHDIYHVIEYFMEKQWESIYSGFDSNPEQSLFAFIHVFTKYKKVWRNLYKARGHTEFSRYINKIIRDILTDVISSRLDITKVDKKDLNIICTFYGEAFLGIIVRWLYDSEYKTNADILDSMTRINKIFGGQLDRLIENLAQT